MAGPVICSGLWQNCTRVVGHHARDAHSAVLVNNPNEHLKECQRKFNEKPLHAQEKSETGKQSILLNLNKICNRQSTLSQHEDGIKLTLVLTPAFNSQHLRSASGLLSRTRLATSFFSCDSP
eukprot:3549893-Amphidinium_carterae.1